MLPLDALSQHSGVFQATSVLSIPVDVQDFHAHLTFWVPESHLFSQNEPTRHQVLVQDLSTSLPAGQGGKHQHLSLDVSVKISVAGSVPFLLPWPGI